MGKSNFLAHLLRTSSNARKVLLLVLCFLAVYLTLKAFSSLVSSGEDDYYMLGSGDKATKACLAKWGAAHQDVPAQLNKDAFGCPREPPKHLLSAYTQGGLIEVVNWWKCQTGPEYDKKHAYTKEQIDEQVTRVTQRLANYYGDTDFFVYASMDKFSIKDKSVVIMGSQRPIYEAVCLVYGAESCTTIDFQPITIPPYPRYTTMTLDQYDKSPISFDAAISISSFEHDGLGRYGDPLRPNGDVDMMQKMKCIVKPGGLLFLSVPIAKDKIVWNMHRVYGQIRLPKLIEGWTLLEVFADSKMFARWSGCDADKEGDYQPIFVLKNQEPEPGHNVEVLNKFIDPKFKPGTSCF